jgi:hypothetical protein
VTKRQRKVAAGAPLPTVVAESVTSPTLPSSMPTETPSLGSADNTASQDANPSTAVGGSSVAVGDASVRAGLRLKKTVVGVDSDGKGVSTPEFPPSPAFGGVPIPPPETMGVLVLGGARAVSKPRRVAKRAGRSKLRHTVSAAESPSHATANTSPPVSLKSRNPLTLASPQVSPRWVRVRGG